MANKLSLSWEKNMNGLHGGCETNWMIIWFPFHKISLLKPPSSCPTQPFGAEAMEYAFSDHGISKEISGGMKYPAKGLPTTITDAKYWKKEEIGRASCRERV